MFNEDELHCLELYGDELKRRGWVSAFNCFWNTYSEFVLTSKYGFVLARFDKQTFALIEIRDFDEPANHDRRKRQ